MTSFIPVAPCVRRWMQSIHSAVPRAFSSLYSSIAATANCRFVPITSARICRPRRANRFRCACKKPTANQRRFGWKENHETDAIYWGARAFCPLRPACCRRACSPDVKKVFAAECRELRPEWSPSPMTTRWKRKDLLGLRELSADEINFVLETTDAFKQVGTREIKKVPALRGKTLVNFFVEPSTRTRTSFELAAFRLSADVINISATTSSLTKGETLKDTARNLEALQADIIVLRHSSAGAPQFLASRLKASVINAGDGAHEHPTQALLDLYTIRERRGKIAGLHIAIIGDILFSRVARSNIFGLLKLGARVTLVGPSTLVPREFEKLGAEISHKIEDVLPTADV